MMIIFDLVMFILACVNMKKYRIYSKECHERTSGVIVKYDKLTDDTTMSIYLRPVYTYSVDGKTYTGKNDVYLEKMIKKDVDVIYCKDNPKYSYIEQLGMPNLFHAANVYIFSIIFMTICFAVGFLYLYYAL